MLDSALDELKRKQSEPQAAPQVAANGYHVPVEGPPLISQVTVEPLEPVAYRSFGAAQAVPPPPPLADPYPVANAQTESPPVAAKTLQPLVSSREQKQRAAQSVHINSYLEMGEELLNRGKMDDFDKLLELARADNRVPPESILHLEQLRGD